MKGRISLGIVVPLLVVLFTAFKVPVPDPPSGLMVEFIREPSLTMILDPNPEFSWVVPSNAVRQSAFQIIVSSSESKLTAEKVDLWNSSRIPGSRSTEIGYSGKKLSENSVYFWKVRIWDYKDDLSPWSVSGSFRTGRLNKDTTTGNTLIESRNKPVLFRRTGNESYFIDFGKAAFGSLTLEINSPKADTLSICIGEKLSRPETIDSKPGGTIRYYQTLLLTEAGKKTYRVSFPKDERNTGPLAIRLPDSLGVLVPFRYCSIENCSSDLEAGNVIQNAFWYYFDDSESSFISSDTILNKIWDLCKYSIKATSFAGYYIDGDRERIPYEADAYINQLGHYYTDREYSLARRTNEYFIHHPTWPAEWILMTPLMFYNDIMFTGNTESAARYYKELINKTLIGAARPDGLISSENITDDVLLKTGFADTKEKIRDIVDWPPAQKDTGWKLATPEGERDGYDMVEINTVVNAFHYRSLEAMADIAGFLGKSVDSALFRTRALKVRYSINEKLFNHESGIYLDGEFSEHSSLHANMMALASGIVPDEHKRSVVDFIKSRGMACSVYGAQFLLEGLFMAGENEYALELLTSLNDRGWYNMIRSGSTMTMEAWDMKYKPNSDWNHAWGAAPANIIPAYLWGIRPLEPGFSRAVINPRTGNLGSSSVTVPIIRGSIHADYLRSGDSLVYNISIPGNIDCLFITPSVNYLTISHNEKSINPEEGFILLKPGNNKIILK